MPNDNELTCDVCGSERVRILPVASLPGSAAYCGECRKANAHPWWALVNDTAKALSVDDVDDWRHAVPVWWQEMVDSTLARLGRTEHEFKAAVCAAIHAADPPPDST